MTIGLRTWIRVACALTLSPAALSGAVNTPNVTGPCYSSDPSPYLHFATKTLYEDVRGRGDVREQAIPGCQPSLIYLLARYGARNPSGRRIREMGTSLPALRDRIVQQFNNGNSSLCTEDLVRLTSWTFPLRGEDRSQLSDVGYQEMKDLAQRFQVRFPGLLRKTYSSSDIEVRSTYKKRTQDSAKGFLDGLYNRTDISPTFRLPNDDLLLRFSDSCRCYQRDVRKQSYLEQNKFMDGSIYTQMVRNVEHRLGFHVNSLSKDDVFIMYRMCIYGHVLNNDSPWCAVFSEDDLKVMEYSEDLEQYYRYSYGAPACARDQTCELLKDFFSHIRNGSAPNYTGPRAVLRFGHSKTFQPFLSALGLYKDPSHLTAQNMADQANRKWKTSIIAPFAANIAFVVYTCEGSSSPKLQTFINDKPVTLPGCSGTLCDLNQAIQDSRKFSDSCDFDQVCDNPTGQSPSVKSFLSLLRWMLSFLPR